MHTDEFALENDWNQGCYDAGYGDGQIEQFSQSTSAHCGDKPNGAKSYYLGYYYLCAHRIVICGYSPDIFLKILLWGLHSSQTHTEPCRP
jgi:hypothetical protein